MRISSSKICPLAYFTMKLARLSCPIAFHANGNTIFLDLLLRTSVEETFCIFRCQYNKFLFLQVVSRGYISRLFPKIIWERFSGMAVPTRKGRLVGLLLALTRQAASALLKLSSPTLTSWCGLCQQPDWAPCWLSACALTPWDCSWSLQGHGPNSAASSTLGSSKRIFAIDDWHAAECWLVLGGPWKACSRPHKTSQSPTRRFL